MRAEIFACGGNGMKRLTSLKKSAQALPEKEENSVNERLRQMRAITPRQFEEIYNIPRGSQANMRWAKRGPKYYKVGARRVVYLIEDVEEWLRRNPVITLDSPEGKKRN
jgi:hypothetical protein